MTPLKTLALPPELLAARPSGGFSRLLHAGKTGASRAATLLRLAREWRVLPLATGLASAALAGRPVEDNEGKEKTL